MAKLPPKRPLPWRPGRTTSCAEEELPLWASAMVALEDDAVGLALGAIGDQRSMKKMSSNGEEELS